MAEPYVNQHALVLAALAGNEEARGDLVTAFTPRIAAMAREYRGIRAVNREELLQAGVVGLLRALERYDPERANQFWTYARWWVRAGMQELVSSLNNVVVLSDRALRQLAQISAARRERTQSSLAEPSTTELAEITGLPRAQVERLVGATQPASGLSEAAYPGRPDGGPLAETLRDPASEDAFDHATLRVAARSLPAALSVLTPREGVIVRGRFGIGGRRRSVAELALELSVSTQRVRQIEQGAMRKLRESCDVDGRARAMA
jgi:RNA polymerase sigma factor (sigma-70 family)